MIHKILLLAVISLSLSLSTNINAQANTGSCPDDWERRFEPDPELYPFSSNCFIHEMGVLHYVDEVHQESEHTILFVHGNPSWSILHQAPMQAMIEEGYRVVSLDQFGFGLSDKPSPEVFDYTPRQQSIILEELVTALDLQNITLVQDFEGELE